MGDGFLGSFAFLFIPLFGENFVFNMYFMIKQNYFY